MVLDGEFRGRRSLQQRLLWLVCLVYRACVCVCACISQSLWAYSVLMIGTTSTD